MSDKTATSAVLANDAKRFLTAESACATDSMSVFHAPQLGHFPNHLGLVPPQSLQVNTVLSFAIRPIILYLNTVDLYFLWVDCYRHPLRQGAHELVPNGLRTGRNLINRQDLTLTRTAPQRHFVTEASLWRGC